MKIIIKATETQKRELLANAVGKPELKFVENLNEAADVYIDLTFNERKPVFLNTDRPVLVNAVAITANQLPENYIRINGWDGFLGRSILEVVAREDQQEMLLECMNLLGRKFQLCPDIPGMISARIIATIINEAYFLLEEDITSEAAIDTAMKLGTNYPYGPIEWGQKIGLSNIVFLLEAMEKEDAKYAVSKLLKERTKGF